MSFGEANNTFFWLGYLKECDRSFWCFPTLHETKADMWMTYCMGGEL